MAVFCTQCGSQNEDSSQFCVHCQATLPAIGSRPTAYQSDYQQAYQSGYEPIQPPAPMYGQGSNLDWQSMGADKKIVAGILAIVIGGFGVHKFILGYQREGIIMLLVSLLSCGMLGWIMHIVAIAEGIIYLTQSDENFVRTYVQGRKGWF